MSSEAAKNAGGAVSARDELDTPRLEDIRGEYCYTDRYGGDYDADLKARFDSWLAAYTRQVKADAWDEGGRARVEWIGRLHVRGETGEPPTNPYRITEENN